MISLLNSNNILSLYSIFVPNSISDKSSECTPKFCRKNIENLNEKVRKMMKKFEK